MMMSDTVYEYVCTFWSTLSDDWCECSYWSLTPDNDQFILETLIRDEENTAENISLQVDTHTLEWFDSCGYGRSMLI